MKLKKIASLALASVLAVSMLAGCDNNTKSEENNQAIPVANVVTYANEALTASQKEELSFKASSTLDTWVKAIATDADKFTAQDIKSAYTKATTLAGGNQFVGEMQKKLRSNLQDSNVLVANNDFKTLPADKASQSQGWIYVQSGMMDEKAAVEAVANDIATWAIDNGNCPATIDKYNCKYEIEISSLKVTNDSLNGESAWVIAVVITQNVTKAANVEA